MTLYKLKTAPTVLIEDDYDKNIVPLLLELANYDKHELHMLCYEKPASYWKCVFKNKNVIFHEDPNIGHLEEIGSSKCSVIIDSINQMSLCLGWTDCFKHLRRFISSTDVVQLIFILHKDCLSHYSKTQSQLHHIASAIVSYDAVDSSKIWVQLKKSGKIVKSEEILTYDSRTSTLKSNIVIKNKKKEEEPAKPLPSSLSTFKIEMDQTEKLEKYKLKLPYMSKIHSGESKVYYEPDAVDDWDEEDPDEDLDI
ncbi:elongator complex protein 5 [Cydia fagiglandana]|uniref:elongator complex protein 5 n=1 Tax=Cydia fagiglandana TaxID=1458189 RepID=UPI002FEDF164